MMTAKYEASQRAIRRRIIAIRRHVARDNRAAFARHLGISPTRWNNIERRTPLTLKVAKEALRASERLPIEDGITYERDLFCLCFSSADKEEGVKAFLEKRPAQWTGR